MKKNYSKRVLHFGNYFSGYNVLRVFFVFSAAIFLIFITTVNVSATQYYSISNGSWTSSSSWTTIACGQSTNVGSYPSSNSDSVTICYSYYPVLPAGTTTISNLALSNFAAYTIPSGSTLIVTGTYTNSNLGTSLAGSGTLEINNGVSNTLGTFSQFLSLIVGDGITTTSVTNGVTLFYSLTINASSTASFTGIVSIWGNFTNNGTYSNPSSTTEIENNSGTPLNHIISGNTVTTFYSLGVNASGGGTVTLQQSVIVSKFFGLSSGIVYDTGGYTITMLAGSSVNSGPGNISFVNGPVTKLGSTSFTFPVGKGTEYRPIEISNVSAVDTFTAQYYHVDPDSVKPKAYYTDSLGPGLNHVSRCEYWMLNNPAGKSTTATVTLSWDEAYSCTVDSPTTLVVARWDTTSAVQKWMDEGNNFNNDSYLYDSLQGPGSSLKPSVFGPFTLASIDTSNPLPIQLLNFDALYNGKAVDIYWSTASEINNDYFTVEKTKDGTDFTTVGMKDGAGNSDRPRSYFLADPFPYQKVSYYRLKQTDYDGHYTYSALVPVNVNSSNSGSIMVVPNPASDKIYCTLDMKGQTNAALSIFDMKGSQVIEPMSVTFNNSVLMPFDVSALATGIYTVRVVTNDLVWNTKLVKN